MRHVIATLSGVVLFLCAVEAQGQGPVCTDRQTMLQTLEQRYGERIAVRALADHGQMIEITRGRNGSWTALVTIPGGPTCMTGSGEAMQILEPGEPS